MGYAYPIIVGGKPLFSLPAFVPVWYEMTVLSSCVAAFLSNWILSGLPRPHHPAFASKAFERATDDLLNFMNNIEVATTFLDDQLRVKRFTPQARSVAHLIDADIGRPLADLTTLLDYPDLLSDAASVIETLHASETQAAAPGGSWYLVRIRPYRTARNTVEGVVITFVDITDAKRTERLQAARLLAESIVDAVREPFLVLDRELRVIRANRAYYRAFESSRRRLPAADRDLGSHQWIIPTLRERWRKPCNRARLRRLRGGDRVPHLGRRRLLLNARPLSAKMRGRRARLARDPN